MYVCKYVHVYLCMIYYCCTDVTINQLNILLIKMKINNSHLRCKSHENKFSAPIWNKEEIKIMIHLLYYIRYDEKVEVLELKDVQTKIQIQ